VHTETPLTESVFLDDLAGGMVEVGKAKFVTKEEAIDNIKKHQKNPIIVSKVSGQHSEICLTWPKKCLYWNMERHKLKCINR
jgi:methylmalonyl-CoA mutase cobalamin-binding subunit